MAKNKEKEIHRDKQIKVAKVFRVVVSAGMVAPVSVSAVACAKEAAVVEELEQAPQVEENIKTPQEETKIEENTQKTETPPVVPEVKEEQAGPVEYEGVIVPHIEGLRFEEGTFYAQEGNPYGLETEAKAGVFIKEAFELDGQMENSIGLSPKVIEYMHDKIANEEGKILVPLPFDFSEAKDVIIEKVKYLRDDYDGYPLEDTSFLINAPIGTKIYSIMKSEETDYPRSGFWALNSSSSPDEGFYNFGGFSDLEIHANPMPIMEEYFTNPFKYEGFDVPAAVGPGIECQGVELSMETFQGNSKMKEIDDRPEGSFEGSIGIGVELATIVSLPKQELGQPPFFSGLCSVEIYMYVEDFGVLKRNVSADNLILEIEGIKTSILPIND